jgi:hypothetical protein
MACTEVIAGVDEEAKSIRCAIGQQLRPGARMAFPIGGCSDSDFRYGQRAALGE